MDYLKGDNIFYKYFKLTDVAHISSLDHMNEGNKTFFPKIWENIDLSLSLYDNYTYAYLPVGNKIKERFLPVKGRLRNIRGYFYYQNKPYTENVNTSFLSFMSSLFNKRDITLGGFLKNNLKSDIIIFADYQPKFIQEHLISKLRLTDKIEDFINKFTIDNQLHKNGIGIHIRATDRKQNDAIEKVMSKIDEICHKEKKLNVFLATDNIDIEKQLREILSSRDINLITHTKFTPKVNQGDGGIHHWAQKNNKYEYAEIILRESIFDIWTLSKCKYLLFMGNSSFSKIAVALHSRNCINWLE